MKNVFTNTILVLCAFCTNLFAKTFTIGLSETYKKVSEVVSLIDHGDTIFIKKGTYLNDKQVTISKNNIYIIGEEGRPILQAGDIIANDQSNGKGIFVIKGNHVTIDNIAFYDAKVVDNNGAGIRQEGCDLKVLRCLFVNNEMGILCGTIPNCKTTIEYCEFLRNGSIENPGYQHNVYINNIDTLIFRFNRCVDATAQGHELKSRAKFNYIAYNTIANYTTDDSRTIDLPNGGISIILGNVIEQGPNSANNNILGYGLEGLSNPSPHGLYIVNNTFVNRRGNGSHVHVPNNPFGDFVMSNNIMIGGGVPIVGNQASLQYESNMSFSTLEGTSAQFESLDSFNYALVFGSDFIDKGKVIEKRIGDYDLIPSFEFHGIAKVIPRQEDGAIDVGAFEFVKPSDVDEVERLKYYPNPVSDILFFPNVSDGQIKFYNQYGQITQLICEDERIDVSLLSFGFYTFRLDKVTYRIIKM